MIKEKQVSIRTVTPKKEEAKLSIIRDYYENGLSVEDVVSKYRLNSKYLFYQWLGQYVGKSLSLNEFKDTDPCMQKKKDSLDSLTSQEKYLKIKSLEKALELEKLRSRGFEVMIDVAENQLNIPIRKKAGTKQ
jgi:transposase-like protein